MPLAELDPDYARGKRRPSPVPGKGAQMNIEDIRSAAVLLENRLKALLLDSSEKRHCLHSLDAVLCHAEALILRYDRNGPPVGQSMVQDFEATLRVAQAFPDQFQSGFVKDLNRNIADLRKKGG